jgi:hypothetical protein
MFEQYDSRSLLRCGYPFREDGLMAERDSLARRGRLFRTELPSSGIGPGEVMKLMVRSEVFVTVTSRRNSVPALMGPFGAAIVKENNCLGPGAASAAKEVRMITQAKY